MSSSAVITKDLTIGEVVQTYPEIIPVLMEYGIHCVGCHVSAYETLGQGFMGHGYSEKQVEEIISELNKAVKKNAEKEEKTDLTGKNVKIELTEAAAKKVKEMLKQQKKESAGLRIQVLPGGCSGFVYQMEFEEKPKKSDVQLESHGVKIFVAGDSIEYLEGTKIEFVDSLSESGFKFDNPNAGSSCGCGKSFS